MRVFKVNSGVTATLENLVIANGKALSASGSAGGGGLYNDGGTVTLNGCRFVANTDADGLGGGGLLNTSAGTVTISNSVFGGNTAQSSSGDGGGIRSQGGLTLTNTTFVENSATGSGGGFWVSTSTPTTLTNTTFVANAAATAGGGIANVGDPSKVTLKNTLLAGNTTGGNCSGSGVVNGGNNLDDGTTCNFGSSNNSLSSTDPLLGPFDTTFPLLPGSPAINAGTNTGCPSTDQRSTARPQGLTCDIGAFESQGFTLTKSGGDNQSATVGAAFTNPLTVTVTSDQDEPVEGGKITFTPPATGASATLGTPNPATIACVDIDKDLICTASVTATANSTAGSYQVTASTTGASDASFNLTNSSAVNGTCGSANGISVSSAPTINLCSTGTASEVSGSGPWNWNCNGSTIANCSAQLYWVPPPVIETPVTPPIETPVTPPVIEPEPITDADNDGQNDALETGRDTDNDGITDNLDHDDDNDGIDSVIESQVPAQLTTDGRLVAGDGNGDGIADTQQLDVSSLPWSAAPDGQTRFVTLTNDAGLTQTEVRALPPPAVEYGNQSPELPLGQLEFEVQGFEPGGTIPFSVFIDGDIPVNGYYKQNTVTGAWVNVATAIIEQAGRTQINFAVEDGGPFDSDGLVNGSIRDPGGPGFAGPMAQIFLPANIAKSP